MATNKKLICGCIPIKRSQKFGNRQIDKTKERRSQPVPKTNSYRTLAAALLYEPTTNVRIKQFRDLRTLEVDDDECLGWTQQMVAYLDSTVSADEVAHNLQIAIRRGVPDGLKKRIFLQLHSAGAFLAKNPHFYESVLRRTFGAYLPTTEKCPTFTGGFLGVLEDIHGAPVDVSQWEVDIDVPIRRTDLSAISWHDLGQILTQPQIGTRSMMERPVLSDDELAGGVGYRNYVEDTTISRRPHAQSLDNIHLSFAVPTSASDAPLKLASTTIGRHLNQADVHSLESITEYCEMLSAGGLAAAKRILWCMHSLHEDVEFCPVLSIFTAILLLYLTEEETFVVMNLLVQHAKECCRSNSPRIYLTYRRSDFVRFTKVSVAIATRHLPTLSKHLQTLGVDLPAWFARCIQDGLSKLLPFDYVLRIMGAFLFEGAKVFQRYALAVLKLEETNILKCQTKEQATAFLFGRDFFRKGNSHLAMLEMLTKTAFQFSIRSDVEPIGKYTSVGLPTPYLAGVQMQRLYRPRLAETSEFVVDDEWETLYGWLPGQCRILDPSLAYSSSADGMSILGITRRVADDGPMIFVILTTDDELIGGFSPFTFGCEEPDGLDLSICFVFQLRPNVASFAWTGRNKSFIKFSSADGIFVGTDDVAIWVDRDISRGTSRPSRAFASPSLVSSYNGDFTIRAMEIWQLV